MAIPMLKIRRPNGRLIFNMWIPIPGKDGLYIETAPCLLCLITQFLDFHLDDEANKFELFIQSLCVNSSLSLSQWRYHTNSQSLHHFSVTWWRHQRETFSALLALCAGNSPVTDEFPSQRPVTRSFDVFFDLPLSKRLSKQSRGLWFETPSRPFWRHCYEMHIVLNVSSSQENNSNPNIDKSTFGTYNTTWPA